MAVVEFSVKIMRKSFTVRNFRPRTRPRNDYTQVTRVRRITHVTFFFSFPKPPYRRYPGYLNRGTGGKAENVTGKTRLHYDGRRTGVSGRPRRLINEGLWKRREEKKSRGAYTYIITLTRAEFRGRQCQRTRISKISRVAL